MDYCCHISDSPYIVPLRRDPEISPRGTQETAKEYTVVQHTCTSLSGQTYQLADRGQVHPCGFRWPAGLVCSACDVCRGRKHACRARALARAVCRGKSSQRKRPARAEISRHFVSHRIISPLFRSCVGGGPEVSSLVHVVVRVSSRLTLWY